VFGNHVLFQPFLSWMPEVEREAGVFWRNPNFQLPLTFGKSFPPCDCPDCVGLRSNVLAGFDKTKKYLEKQAEDAQRRHMAAAVGMDLPDQVDDDDFDLPLPELRRHGSGPSFILSGSPAADKLTTHANAVHHLKHLMSYDFPTASQQACTWGAFLEMRSQPPPRFPPSVMPGVPRAALVHSAGQTKGFYRKRPADRVHDGPRCDHFATMERKLCGGCSTIGCSCTGLWDKHKPSMPKDPPLVGMRHTPPVNPVSSDAAPASPKSPSKQRLTKKLSKSQSLGTTLDSTSRMCMVSPMGKPRTAPGHLKSANPPLVTSPAGKAREGIVWQGW